MYIFIYQLSSILLSFGKWGILELLTSHSVFDGRGGMFNHALPARDDRIHYDDDKKFSEEGSFWSKLQSLLKSPYAK